jgi:hypothetical protein
MHVLAAPSGMVPAFLLEAGQLTSLVENEFQQVSAHLDHDSKRERRVLFLVTTSQFKVFMERQCYPMQIPLSTLKSMHEGPTPTRRRDKQTRSHSHGDF